jgi:SAM-dependent methyltransferase
LRVKVVPQQAEDLFENGVAQRVINLIPGLPADDDLPGAENSQMLRSVRLFEFQLLDQLSGGELAFPQRFDYGDPRGVGEALKNSGLEVAKFLCHYKLVYSIIHMPEPDRKRARELAAQSRTPTEWFEQLYHEHTQGQKVVPWADLGVNPNLLQFEGAGKAGLVVGCGFGDDAEQIAMWGFETTAFDVAPSAIRAARQRFPETRVQYVTADLLNPPEEWTGRFDFVLESYTLQALPRDVRARAIHGLAGFVRKGGIILLIARGRDEDEPEGLMPWPLTRGDLDQFTALGLREQSFEDYLDNESPPVRRFRAVFVK